MSWPPCPPPTAGTPRTRPRCRDVLDDPDHRVRATAVIAGIHRQDGARWKRVLDDPHAAVRRAAAVHGYFTPRFVWTALAADPVHGVRKAVAASRHAPAEVRRRLLSDPDPAVATAAATRDPLAAPVRVRPTLPADAELALPASHSADPGLRLLDLTVATLTFDRQRLLAKTAARTDPAARDAARDRALRLLGHGEHARRIAERWIRWTDLFALPAPISGLAWVAEQLAAPFTALPGADDRIRGALTLFDAVLGLTVTPDTDQGRADRTLLTTPWKQVCLPPEHTPTPSTARGHPNCAPA